MIEENDEHSARRYRQLVQEAALEEFVLRLAREIETAIAAIKAAPTEANVRWRNEAISLLEVFENHPDLPYIDPSQDKPHPCITLVRAATGVIGFDEAGGARIDIDQIVPTVGRQLMDNQTFQRLANEYLWYAFGGTLSFNDSGRLSGRHLSPLSPNGTHGDRSLN